MQPWPFHAKAFVALFVLWRPGFQLESNGSVSVSDLTLLFGPVEVGSDGELSWVEESCRVSLHLLRCSPGILGGPGCSLAGLDWPMVLEALVSSARSDVERPCLL